ncbi:enolase-phosphatase E1 [Magallana gigas]|uniref:Enolase-phosphatase E1 n=2 Tax=Magallana gigas TaxID=29159 RepID=K1PQI4_MAGGI|nr:enolase-phosphatase E1 [Crassostrea gigas]|eukprot:XP_011428851.1 PREDICTED: enolase-phosphatase E1 [Crassostrea gigas]
MEGQQKRTIDEAEPSLLEGVKALIVDIEGTTTPIGFVKETLFPYAEENVESFLTKRYDDEETQQDIKALQELAAKDKADGVEGVVEIPKEGSKEDIIKAVVDNVKWQMDEDRKTTALKQLQGHIWREGYKTGQIKAELFEDVGPALQQIVEEGVNVYVYSSGSVEAQKLLFGNTEEGDLLELFTDFFDTTIGNKKDSGSYKKIVEKIGVSPEEILFLTDTPEEATAASKAGLRSALVARDGNEELTEEHFQNFLVIESFGELFGDDDDEDYKRLEGEDNGEVDDEDEDEDDLGEEEEEPEDDEGEDEDDA